MTLYCATLKYMNVVWVYKKAVVLGLAQPHPCLTGSVRAVKYLHKVHSERAQYW